jgi:hypothetical protein
MSPAVLMRLYEAAANAHDLEAMLNLIADDALFLFSDGTAHFGKDAIRKAIQANFDAIGDEIYRIPISHGSGIPRPSRSASMLSSGRERSEENTGAELAVARLFCAASMGIGAWRTNTSAAAVSNSKPADC